MRKNSKIIWQEICLDKELKSLPPEDYWRLRNFIDDLNYFRKTELEALDYIVLFYEKTDSKNIKNFIKDAIINHARKILAMNGLTIEGFKDKIEELEKKQDDYDKS